MKKSDQSSLPSDAIWGCKVRFLTSLNDYLSNQATKKWRRRKPSRKIPAIWMCNVWQTISLCLLFQRLSNMYFSDEWKKSDLNSVPSEPIWGCKIISLTSLKGFLSVHATKKWRRRKPWRKISAVWMRDLLQTIPLSLLFQTLTVKYVLQWRMKKDWPDFCPFRPFLRLHNNISDIFERFPIRSCHKKMKTQETFKKNSGRMNARRATNNSFIFTPSNTDCLICTSVKNEKSLTWFLSLQTLFEVAQ